MYSKKHVKPRHVYGLIFRTPDLPYVYAELERQDVTFSALFEKTIKRPFLMLAKEPILVLMTMYLSLVYGLFFALFQAVPIIFKDTRGLDSGQAGLIFIGLGIGTMLGAIIFSLTSSISPALVQKWRGYPPPEYRLYSAMIGSPILVVGCFWLGWTGHYSDIPWYVPAISTIPVGLGISSIFMSLLAYLVDTYVVHAASAVAALTVVRSGVAAAFPLFTTQLFDGLGINWACSLIGFIVLAFTPAPFLFLKFGLRIRQKSTFAPCMDLEVSAQISEEERVRKEVSFGAYV